MMCRPSGALQITLLRDGGAAVRLVVVAVPPVVCSAPAGGPRGGTKETSQPCVRHLHIISLVVCAALLDDAQHGGTK